MGGTTLDCSFGRQAERELGRFVPLIAHSSSVRSARSALPPRLLASVRGTTGDVLALAPEATVDAWA
jgi:hypothetical protein